MVGGGGFFGWATQRGSPFTLMLLVANFANMKLHINAGK